MVMMVDVVVDVVIACCCERRNDERVETLNGQSQ